MHAIKGPLIPVMRSVYNVVRRQGSLGERMIGPCDALKGSDPDAIIVEHVLWGPSWGPPMPVRLPGCTGKSVAPLCEARLKDVEPPASSAYMRL